MRLLFACFIVFTSAMAFIPIADIPNVFNIWDKVQHALAFAMLTIAGTLAYPKRVKLVCAGLMLYGMGIEVVQSNFTTTRFGEVSDLLADVVGIAAGWAIYLLVRKVTKDRS